MVESRSQLRRSFLRHSLEAAGARFEVRGDTAVAGSFGDQAKEAAAFDRVALLDLSPLPRGGFKGEGTADWLTAQGVQVPAESNRAARQAEGLALRLAPGEVLLLDDPLGDGGWSDALEAAWWAQGCPPATPRGFPVPRRDSHCWLRLVGPSTPAMFAKLCSVDLRPNRFGPFHLAQTSVARLSAIVLREDLGDRPGYHLLADSASADYLWDVLLDAMAEFDGRPAGLDTLRHLA